MSVRKYCGNVTYQQVLPADQLELRVEPKVELKVANGKENDLYNKQITAAVVSVKVFCTVAWCLLSV